MTPQLEPDEAARLQVWARRNLMGKFQITLIRPPGYLHTEAFRELGETLQVALQSLGHTARTRENLFDPGWTSLILGAHLLSPDQMQELPRASIIYNLEQLGGAQLKPDYYTLATRYQIWDYDLHNIEHWKRLTCAYVPVHVPIGYVPELSRIKPGPQQDIDVLFYGSLNDRRNRILNALKDAGVKVHTAFGLYGKDRDELIARSKLVLNVHYYESKVFEIVRVSYLLANSKAVVTERSAATEMESGLSTAVLSLPYDGLVEGCKWLLQNQPERQALETRGLQWFSQRKESEILNNALQQSAKLTPTTDAGGIPRKLNMGSGKDWREDHFNTDFDPYWEPDAVLDFSRDLPIGQPLETQRFGTVALQNDFFDEITANDVLEHIPNLTLAMTSCLNLLRVGGVFRICVPYDLSWGAWQDPTHVRAFNERSWLYYTDWFWYMGWTEARFDLAQFDLGLSPVGQALAKQQIKGEDLVRHPRAVDQLKVVLRKRLLTEEEKHQVTMYLKRPNRGGSRSQTVSVKMQSAVAQAATAP